ncbi:stage V sporulation protein AB [Evansella caseinilytica]|uniref:Stage V sporulation protein AB n=1 Tax=Evansella caseinilytica TaxID=1503961 RepID=A0A1H3L6X6_9BACI|nr:stage V sporulation protein AB [Evansella caseinilytica]SDY59959.1 stage V sporulation protein AB [Evansella caseinilytica]
MIDCLCLAIIGLAWGLAVGGGLVAFITVLGIVPRLADLTKTANRLINYEAAVITGAIAGALVSLLEPRFGLANFFVVFIGLGCGIFIGLLAAALTEVLNVFPILAKRVGLEGKTHTLLWAIVLGKVIGSLYHWIFFVRLGSL